jgi:uncharacterized membrane protein
MTSIDPSQDQRFFEVVVAYYHVTSSGCDEPSPACAEGSEYGGAGSEDGTPGGPVPEVSAVSVGIYCTYSAQAAKYAAAKAAGFGSVSDWHRRLTDESNWPVVIDAVQTPAYHLSDDDRHHIVIVLDDYV